MIRFTIPGRPVPHVRMTQRGKYVKAQAGRYLAYKDHVAWLGKQAGLRPTHAPISLSCTFYIHIGFQAPDIDGSNLLKAIEDGLEGIAYHNDRQILVGSFRKVLVDHKDQQRAEIEIEEVAKDDVQQDSRGTVLGAG